MPIIQHSEGSSSGIEPGTLLLWGESTAVAEHTDTKNKALSSIFGNTSETLGHTMESFSEIFRFTSRCNSFCVLPQRVWLDKGFYAALLWRNKTNSCFLEKATAKRGWDEWTAAMTFYKVFSFFTKGLSSQTSSSFCPHGRQKCHCWLLFCCLLLAWTNKSNANPRPSYQNALSSHRCKNMSKVAPTGLTFSNIKIL